MAGADIANSPAHYIEDEQKFYRARPKFFN